MGRRKKLSNEDVFYMKDCAPKIDYSGIRFLIEKYNISYFDFCDLAHISTETMQRINNNEQVCIKTLLKIINALNKLNTNRKHSLDDIVSIIYINSGRKPADL